MKPLKRFLFALGFGVSLLLFIHSTEVTRDDEAWIKILLQVPMYGYAMAISSRFWPYSEDTDDIEQ